MLSTDSNFFPSLFEIFILYILVIVTYAAAVDREQVKVERGEERCGPPGVDNSRVANV